MKPVRYFYLRRLFMKSKKLNVRALTECAIMVSLATVLSLITLGSFPTGGSITLASMLPIVVLSYRHGLGWGLASAGVASLLQMLLGLSAFSYVTTWQSILAVALLDYVIAFAVYGLSGIFRKIIKDQSLALTVGAFSSACLRYLCHVISGATVWAGLSIPDNAAMLYSLSYNATYMVPDTLILCIVTAYLGSVLDFKRDIPTRVRREGETKLDIALSLTAGAIALFAVIFDVVAIFTRLQSESGEFDITLLSRVNWIAVAIVSAACLITAMALVTAVYLRRRKTDK